LHKRRQSLGILRLQVVFERFDAVELQLERHLDFGLRRGVNGGGRLRQLFA
jgi:hypothetical protein